MNPKYNNTVVKVLNPEHGAEVIKAWKALGVEIVATGDVPMEDVIIENGDFIGIIDGCGTAWLPMNIFPPIEVITLPELQAMAEPTTEKRNTSKGIVSAVSNVSCTKLGTAIKTIYFESEGADEVIQVHALGTKIELLEDFLPGDVCVLDYHISESKDAERKFILDNIQTYVFESEPEKPKTLLEGLNEYFANTPREQTQKDWDATAKYDEVGPTVYDFIKAQKQPERTFPREMMVREEGYGEWAKVKVLGVFNGRYVAEQPNLSCWTVWKYAKEIE